MSGPGDVLGQRYRLDQRIGGGAMGEVWQGTDTALDRTVAVKIVRQELLELPEFRERFLVEARTMARIKHPGVVGVHDYHSDPELAFLVMEYIDGESLSQRLYRTGRVAPVEAMSLVAQAADALQAAHDTGVVHRDVKPGNLLVAEGSRVVLTDFGIARTVASAPLTATGALIGTMSYLAPEQVLGKPATAQSDVYALGVVAYECLTGERPFSGENPFEIAMKRTEGPPPPLPPEIAAPIREVVEQALAVSPEQRWSSAAELARAARRAASGASAGRASVPAQPSAPPASPTVLSSTAPPSTASPSNPQSSNPQSSNPQSSNPQSSNPQSSMAPMSMVPPPPSAGFPAAGYQSPPQAGPAYPAAGPPPGYAPAGFGQPGGYLPPPPYHQQPRGPQNTIGLLGMIFGILGIPFGLCCGLFGVPVGIAGVVLGVIGVRKAVNGEATNRGMALAGVICGGVGILLGFLFFLLGLALDWA